MRARERAASEQAIKHERELWLPILEAWVAELDPNDGDDSLCIIILNNEIRYLREDNLTVRSKRGPKPVVQSEVMASEIVELRREVEALRRDNAALRRESNRLRRHIARTRDTVKKRLDQASKAFNKVDVD